MKKERETIQLIHLEKSYPEGKGQTRILKDLSFSFGRKGLTSLLGNSGSGKTTLLNILSTLDTDYQGQYLFQGVDTRTFSEEEKDFFRNQRIGFVFQESRLLEDFTVEENILLVANEKDSTLLKKRMENLLARVHLRGKEKKKAKDLSGGEKQRVSIVRALINDPEILLADEPTGSLDLENGIEVMDILKEIGKDRLVLLVTHNQELAKSYSDRILSIQDGKVEEVQKEESDAEEEDGKEKKKERKGRFSFSFRKLFHLCSSFLLAKKLKTALVSIGSAIAILGLGLVLSVSAGFQNYIGKLEGRLLSQIPLTIEKVAMENMTLNNFLSSDYVEDEKKLSVTSSLNQFYHINTITEDFTSFVMGMDEELFRDRQVTQSLDFRLLTTNRAGNVVTYEQSPATYLESVFSENLGLKQLLDDKELLLQSYDLIAGSYPEEETDLVLVLPEDNCLSESLLSDLGLDFFTKEEEKTYLAYDKVLEKRWSLVKNDDYYIDITDESKTIEESGIFLKRDYKLREDNLSLLSLTDMNLNVDFEDISKEDFENLLSYVEIPKGVTIDLEDIDFQGKDDLRKTFLSLFQVKEFQTYRTMNEEEKRAYLQEGKGKEVRISGILKVKKDSFLSPLRGGIYYLPEFLSLVQEENAPTPQDENNNGVIDPAEDKRSKIAKSYENNLYLTYDGNVHVHTRTILNESVYDDDIESYVEKRLAYGVETGITGFYLFPKDFQSKEKILSQIEKYNRENATDIQVTDLTETVFSNVEMLIDIILSVLTILTSVSLFVAVILIASILYSNVLERTKEIGLFRALGARKRDVGNVFRLMSVFIGLFSGALGILLTYATGGILNLVLSSLMPSYQLESLFALPLWQALLLLLFSILLSYLSSLVPSFLASRKDPIRSLKEE